MFPPLFVFVGTLAWFGVFTSALWCDSIVASPQAVPFHVCVRIWYREFLVFHSVLHVCVGVLHVCVCVLVDFGQGVFDFFLTDAAEVNVVEQQAFYVSCLGLFSDALELLAHF